MKKFFIIICFLPIYNGCDSGGESQLPAPGRVMMVPRSHDTAAIEQGIDAVPESDGIILQWYDLRDPGVRYYDIYRQNENETYFRKIRRIDLETAFPGSDTVYIDDSEDLVLKRYNYYYVKAVNRDGLEGSASDTVKYMLLLKAETTRPDGSVQGMPVLYWSFPAGDIPNFYLVRIEEEFTNRLILSRKFAVTDFFEMQELDLSQLENPPQFILNFSYRWRLDSVGPDSLFSGSESQWRIFTAQ